jgi:hypothetical protein
MSASMDTRYKWGTVQDTHHNRDPPICAKMRVRFVARSAHIKIACTGDSTRKQSIPFGLRLICAPGAAVATKNIRLPGNEGDVILGQA